LSPGRRNASGWFLLRARDGGRTEEVSRRMAVKRHIWARPNGWMAVCPSSRSGIFCADLVLTEAKATEPNSLAARRCPTHARHLLMLLNSKKKLAVACTSEPHLLIALRGLEDDVLGRRSRPNFAAPLQSRRSRRRATVVPTLQIIHSRIYIFNLHFINITLYILEQCKTVFLDKL
jgi:hypothetical protein